ncbi:hypothetical protein KUCAC02_035503, partial [Chaenocephalus aceratus]
EGRLQSRDLPADLSSSEINPIDPARLQVALSISVFLFKVENSPETAFNMAKKAFEDAHAMIDLLPDDQEAIMQLLKDKSVDYYELLKVSRDASTREIRQAFKRLALTMHPRQEPRESN